MMKLSEDGAFSLHRMLEQQAVLNGEKKIIIYPMGNLSDPKELSYRALHREALRCSLGIRSLGGFTEGSAIIVHLDEYWDGILWFWAVLFAHCVPVMSSPFSHIDEFRQRHIQWLENSFESPFWITNNTLLPMLQGTHAKRIHTTETLLRQRGPEEGKPPVSLTRETQTCYENCGLVTDTAFLMLTSGSTGNAKAVPISHRQVMAAISGKASVRQLPTGRPFLNWIALDHVASLIEIHIQALWLGVDQVHVHTADVVSRPTTFLDLVSQHRVCRSFAPNFFLAKLVQATKAVNKSLNLSSLTVLASGGESNDLQTCISASRLLRRYGAPSNVIVPGFGMTETCAGAIFNIDCSAYDIDTSRDVVSVGKCMPGIQMRVTTAEDKKRPTHPNEIGDLEVRGEVVFSGYYCNPQATADSIDPEGWFRTGDRAFIDTLGNLHLTGRVKDVININGIKLVTAEIQHALERALGSTVFRVVCFPTQTSHTEQITIAYWPSVWPMAAHDLARTDELATQVCMTCAAARPLVFALSERSASLIPVSSLAKISSAKMRAMFEAGLFVDDIASHTRTITNFRQKQSQVATLILPSDNELDLIEDFAYVLDVEVETIGIDSTIFELGFTSMHLVRLKHRVDSRTRISVPIVQFFKTPSIRSLAATLINAETAALEYSLASAYDPVITFQSSGSKAPLWLVHPGVGEVLVFVGLAQQLVEDDRPVYALRAKGFEENQKCFASIEETVETYVAAIKQHQPRGPYAIAGYSYGTMLAFEISKRLDADQGRGAVRFLGSFNLPPHIKDRMRQLSWNMCLLHLAQFLDLVTENQVETLESSRYRLLSRDQALLQVLHDSDYGRMGELGLTKDVFARWADVAYGLQSMAVDYEPKGLVDVIDVFHAIPLKVAAASREEWVNEHLSKWKDFCYTAPRYHEVGGAHYTMIGPHHVRSFATSLMSALSSRGL
ncbi:acetyl-CoA synthetase-like protein [Xylaria arbuscula]|nr:acetyl-CoA synthetase-like protein [Xylaria arbuscula]